MLIESEEFHTTNPDYQPIFSRSRGWSDVDFGAPFVMDFEGPINYNQ